jgi:hypothetical protein
MSGMIGFREARFVQVAETVAPLEVITSLEDTALAQ